MAYLKILTRGYYPGGENHLINYVNNPQKTDADVPNKPVAEKHKAADQGGTKTAEEDVMAYVVNLSKTEDGGFVSGHNCTVADAGRQMLETKRRFGKEKGGIAVHHLIQSFRPGETDPATAHQIGLALAQEKFPDFEVVVGTHTDKAHIHNHFVINSVNFVTGKKLDGSTKSEHALFRLRDASDRLCKTHALSTISPQKQDRNGSTHYFAHKQRTAVPGAAANNKERLKRELDSIVATASSWPQMKYKLREAGYSVKERGNKYWSVLPSWQKKWIRVNKENNLGEDYSIASLERRLAAGKARRTYRVKVKRQMYSMGLYGRYYTAMQSVGILQKTPDRKLYQNQEIARKHNDLVAEYQLLRKYSIRDMATLQKEKERILDESEDKKAVQEVIERIEARYPASAAKEERRL